MERKTNGFEKPNAIIQATDLTIELGGEVILKDVNLVVSEGETVVFIGPSGSGKTVLLKALAGLYKPKKGTIQFRGLKWENMSLMERHEFANYLGMQFQKGALFDEMDSIGNLKYVLKEHTDLSDEEIEKRATECLRMVNLEHAKHLEVHQLSGGMRLRLGVARSIVLNPQILFMDDPTAGLDPVSSDEMAQLILRIKTQMNATLLIITHDVSRAYQFAGRIFLIADKTILETGSAEQTRNHKDPRVQQFLHGWVNGPLTAEVSR